MLHIWSYVQKNYRFEKHSFVEKNFFVQNMHVLRNKSIKPPWQV